MTERGPLPPKLYFRIGEVANLVGVEPHVLRYWEREFRSIRPSKSAKGQRVYSRRDVENLLRVRELLYGQGFTIAGARRRLRDKDSVDLEPIANVASGPTEEERAAGAPVETRASHAMIAVPLTPPVAAPTGPSVSVRAELEALKAEVEAFLGELGGAP
jgi:DNA-binding transcriptional MerR regulator